MRFLIVLISFTLLFTACNKSKKRSSMSIDEGSDFTLIKSVEPEKLSSFFRFTIHGERIYALDYESRVTVMDMSGSYITSFGGQGEGPGEFRTLMDLKVTDKWIYCADREKRITVFDHKGKIHKELKTDEKIEQIYMADGVLYYLSRKIVKAVGLVDFIMSLIHFETGKEVICFKDRMKVRAINNAGKKLRFPWFPAPFPDRKLFIVNDSGKMALLSAHDDFLLCYSVSGFTKKEFNFKLEREPVAARDKKAFFEYLDDVNNTKYSAATKGSVTFPEFKEYFAGAISWGENIALIRHEELIIIDINGNLIRRLRLPSSIEPESYWEFIYPERRMAYYNKKLYYLNTETETLQTFKIKAQKTISEHTKPSR